ncbi:uncharacterized protein LOC133464688 isoform X2 [Cololabis saira]|uniref:uncharacterized protein LOC133464688 isoform X2 n=1 Tax=Cololabis saira TaxID=129043 RepID=UPI002AD40F2B|nr:uncharacterized protein LOC133464688 isoform X2 [Cololabis saira]
MTLRLQLFTIFMLHFEAGISDGIVLHHRAGDDVVLPRECDSAFDPCSHVHWISNNIQNPNTQNEINNGLIEKKSPRADRMSLSSDCSLIINNITAEDAGLYTCRVGDDAHYDTSVYLSVLTVSLYPPDVYTGSDGYVTLHCSLMRHSDLGSCEQNSIIWVDETGTVLLGEGDGFVSGGQKNCVSDLMVKHQRGSKRRFTCQVVEGDRVKIDAEYTLDFTDSSLIDTSVIIGPAVGGVMVVLAVVVALLIVCRRKTKETEDQQNETNVQQLMHHNDDPEINVTYAAVGGFDPNTSTKIKDESENNMTYAAVDHSGKTSAKINVKEEEDVVTYSAVRIKTNQQ